MYISDLFRRSGEREREREREVYGSVSRVGGARGEEGLIVDVGLE